MNTIIFKIIFFVLCATTINVFAQTRTPKLNIYADGEVVKLPEGSVIDVVPSYINNTPYIFTHTELLDLRNGKKIRIREFVNKTYFEKGFKYYKNSRKAFVILDVKKNQILEHSDLLNRTEKFNWSLLFLLLGIIAIFMLPKLPEYDTPEEYYRIMMGIGIVSGILLALNSNMKPAICMGLD